MVLLILAVFLHALIAVFSIAYMEGRWVLVWTSEDVVIFVLVSLLSIVIFVSAMYATPSQRFDSHIVLLPMSSIRRPDAPPGNS